MKNPDPSLEVDEPVDRALRVAIAEMREGIAVRPEWRAELLAKVPARRRRAAIARWMPASLAAVLCLGLGLTALVKWRGSTSAIEPRVASQVRFSIHAPSATQVSLVGDFDHWDPSALPMQRARDGETWTLDVHLRPGRHVFAYAVDGDLKTDPSAPRAVEDDFGVPSSVVVVVASGGTR